MACVGARIWQGKSINISYPCHALLLLLPSVVGPSEPLRERVAMSVGKEDRAQHRHVLSLPRVSLLSPSVVGPGVPLRERAAMFVRQEG